MNGRIELGPQRQRHKAMLDRVIVVGPRRTTRDTILVGVQIGLHRIAASGRPISMFDRLTDRELPEFRKPASKRCERYRLGQKLANGAATQKAFLDVGE